MRYSIFGFNQKRVVGLITVTKGNDSKDITTRLDTTDLLILSHIADYPNRSKVLKQIIDGQVFFWVEYNNLLEELPILNIRKQALADRFKKYILLHLVKQELVAIDKKHQNATFFCMTKVYESLLYEREGGYGSQLQEGMVVNYDTTSSSQLQDINNIINNNNNTSNKKEREDKSSQKKGALDMSIVAPEMQEVVETWLEYKKEKGQTYKPTGFKTFYNNLIKLSDNNPILAMRIVEKSMQNNYAGIFALRDWEKETILRDLPTQQQEMPTNNDMVINGQIYR